MKSRTSFFNATAFRKDITRFLPVWLLYLIGGLLIGLDSMAGYSRGEGYQAYDLARSMAGFGIINFVYALVCAQVLFGDLFNSKLCNALHAMPVRRESWFLTHTVAGLAFSVVPNAILSLCFMPYMDGMWYVSLIWLLGVTLQYLFFFGLAALSAVCAGNRLGMAAIYGITNFLSMIACWFVTNFYEPLLYGLHIRYERFEWFSPVVAISDNLDELVIFDVQHGQETVPEYYGQYMEPATYTYQKLGEGWGYLAVLAVLGVVLLGLGIFLYRKRKLECAGDLLAFQPMKPVFTVIFTLCAGAVAEVLGQGFMGTDYVFLAVGIIVGYFACQMLMQRTVKVFRKMAFLKCAAIGVALAVSILLTLWDPLGITRWVPKADRVDSIVMSNSYHFDYGEDGSYGRSGMLIENPVLIEELVKIHEQVLTEEKVDKYSRADALHLVYRMKDGRTIERRYYCSAETAQRLKKFFQTPEYIMGYRNWNDYLASIKGGYVDFDFDHPLTAQDARSLAEAIKADCESGNVDGYYKSDYLCSVTLVLENKADFNFDCYANSDHVLKWLKEQGYSFP